MRTHTTHTGIDSLERSAHFMRLGAMLRPQGHWGYFRFNMQLKQFSSCAMGAVAEAAGLVRVAENRVTVRGRLKRILRRFMGEAFLMYSSIQRRNDIERWTREEIAQELLSIAGHCRDLMRQAQERQERRAREIHEMRETAIA